MSLSSSSAVAPAARGGVADLTLGTAEFTSAGPAFLVEARRAALRRIDSASGITVRTAWCASLRPTSAKDDALERGPTLFRLDQTSDQSLEPMPSIRNRLLARWWNKLTLRLLARYYLVTKTVLLRPALSSAGPSGPERTALSKKTLLRDVAEHANVSIATGVARSKWTRERRPGTARSCECVSQCLGYRRNMLARNLRRQRLDAIGVIVSDIEIPISARQ